MGATCSVSGEANSVTRDDVIEGDIDLPGLEMYDKFLLYRVSKALDAWPSMSPNIHECDVPKAEPLPLAKTEALGVFFPERDEDWEEDGFLITFLGKLNWNMPFDRTNVEWPTKTSQKEWLGNYFGSNMPTDPEMVGPIPPEDLGLNRSFSWVYFMGLGCSFVRRVRSSDRNVPNGTEFVADLSNLYSYPAKPDYERFGAIAYFDERKRPLGIYVCYLDELVLAAPDNESDAWEHAKMVMNGGCIILTQMGYHGAQCHIIYGNGLVTALREELNPDHPLRRLLKPHTFRTVVVNLRATHAIFGKGGLNHRVFGTSYEGLIRIFTTHVSAFKFQTLPEILEENGMMSEAMENQREYGLADALQYWGLLKKYITSYCDVYYHGRIEEIMADKEAWRFFESLKTHVKFGDDVTYELLMNVLTQTIFVMTAMHENWGTVFGYALSSSFGLARIRRGALSTDVQSGINFAAIALAISLKQIRLINDFKFLLLKDGNLDKTSAIFDEFQQGLQNLSQAIDEVNGQRDIPCFSFNPKYLECGTSI